MKTKYLLLIFPLALALAAVAFVSNDVSKRERLGLALKWSGLESLPVTVSEVDVKPLGSIYSREFLVSFKVEESKLEGWLAESVQAQLNTTTAVDDGWEIFLLQPEAGAKQAELRVNRASGEIELYVLWS